ncbi:ankyrin repeat domain-containing protein [Formosa sp. PL04]|uniref:ankyrin repeat domain-containing protein n=1 Tax=Formosa sp. PL04 TaxID=3081755 RepID=UPI0029815F8B|nr:ankyrin repeat domain-containing protein [Formosa sp. PL04]MDW5288751.1 ankyrin repeat domain-containing protein [Formosa sp. PL04]
MKQEEFLEDCQGGNEKIISLNLKQGLNPNFEINGNTPLNAAIQGDHLHIVKLLIDAGADVNFPITNNETAILMSAAFGNVEILKILISNGAQPHDRDAANSSVICRACQYTNAKFVKTLLDAGLPIDDCSHNWTPLIHAAYKGRLDIVEMLISMGVGINIETQKGQTALMFACEEGHAETVKLLLEAGADPNIGVNKQHHLYGGGRQASPLNTAAFWGYTDIVRMLLAKGADIETSGENDRKNALHLSAIEKHYEVVKELIVAGADPNVKDGYGSTIYSLAEENGVLVALEEAIGENQKNETNDRGDTDISKMVNTISLALENMSLSKTYVNFQIDEGICYLVDDLKNRELIVELEEDDGFDFDIYHENEQEYKTIMSEVFESLESSKTLKNKELTDLKLTFIDHVM